MMINYKNKSIILCSLALLSLMVFNACKKYDNPPQIFEEYGDGINGKAERKVLIINIDGLAGAELEKVAPPNIGNLIKTGKYTYGVLTDAVSSDAATWASMITGVSSAKHSIVDDTYIPVADPDAEHEVNTVYPTFLSRMLDTRPEFKTVTITTDAALNKYMIHADHRILPANDEAVKDSAVNIAQNNAAKAILVDFRAVETAGKAVGYSADLADYKAAIEKTDGYIGEITNAIKARKTYSTEDWLIIVTTNRGGSDTNPKPGFIVCSNPSLKTQAITKSGFNTMHFNGTSTNAVIKADNGLYDAGTDKDFTIQLQIKMNAANYYPGFFSKSTGVDGSVTTGWTLFQQGGDYGVIFGGSANGGKGKTQILAGSSIVDGKWHTITLTVKTNGSARTASLYTDGVLANSGDISATKNISTSNPLILGHKNVDGSDALDFYAADVEYFNVALDDATVQANIALKDVTKHPYYKNLIGYWPIDDGGGGVVSNLAPVGYNFLMKGQSTWDALGNDIPASRTSQNVSDGAVSIVATGPDVTGLIFYWLKVPVSSDWSLDGVGWLSNFELEFLK
ncbi:Type I phosphodiesterase / nucleotide pyrophosphatase [Mucilaginibacter gossypiicola]|uniref:Type I phosphodiesterase / nucleotide pyrophosphatase n=1 Tax=Mucilaginibacter gossypiicola TaxID=551995 RepID=A0A1H8M4U4_9SPHI|nr:LamG-like jellyroll fold domain-containing protein [Mucilaginibacter gossypiicola]SEO12166.1 Type I phosphodiesterase / nucleotide pyrophosphatase [Mucilaginibacter gossypiicola]